MGFKCREMPSLAVFKSSGVQCLYYEAKEKKAATSLIIPDKVFDSNKQWDAKAENPPSDEK